MKLILAIITAILLTACSQKVPDFAVSVKLTNNAETRLQALNESVMVAASLDGDGISLPWQHTAPFRDVFLGDFSEEVNGMNVAYFKDKTISSITAQRLYDKNYYVTINVFSARKAVKHNILNCDVPIHRIEEIRNRTLEINCDLLNIERLNKPIETDRE
jgi:hypothetical protein